MQSFQNNHSIAILLATYNGEKYLSELIESIIEQSYTNWTLFISDDGSIDDTIQIITYFQKRDSRIKVLSCDAHSGAKRNFINMLEMVEANYYMFADQDDIWLKDKIEKLIKKIIATERTFPETAILVHSDLTVVDSELNIISNSFWKYSKIRPDILLTFNYLGVCNSVTGCTMIINNQAKKCSLPMPDSSPMHDWWIAINVSKKGILEYINEPLVLYRQHGINVVGARSISMIYFLKKIVNIRRTIQWQSSFFPFLKSVGYGSLLKYYFYKIAYTISRNIHKN